MDEKMEFEGVSDILRKLLIGLHLMLRRFWIMLVTVNTLSEGIDAIKSSGFLPNS